MDEYQSTPEDARLCDMLAEGHERWLAGDDDDQAEQAVITARALAVPDGISKADIDTIMLIGQQCLGAILAQTARGMDWRPAIHIAILSGIQHGRLVPASQEADE
jgi:hypothetical protein